MLAALATLLFGATLWLVFLLALRMFEESWAKMVSAVRGEPLCGDRALRAPAFTPSVRQPGRARLGAAA